MRSTTVYSFSINIEFLIASTTVYSFSINIEFGLCAPQRCTVFQLISNSWIARSTTVQFSINIELLDFVPCLRAVSEETAPLYVAVNEFWIAAVRALLCQMFQAFKAMNFVFVLRVFPFDFFDFDGGDFVLSCQRDGVESRLCQFIDGRLAVVEGHEHVAGLTRSVICTRVTILHVDLSREWCRARKSQYFCFTRVDLSFLERID